MIAKKDLAVLDRFAFDIPPVGVKFLPTRPRKLERLAETTPVKPVCMSWGRRILRSLLSVGDSEQGYRFLKSPVPRAVFTFTYPK